MKMPTTQTTQTEPNDRTFKARFCAHTGCKPNHFEARVLMDCRHRSAWVPHLFMVMANPLLFQEDVHLIRALGQTTDLMEFQQELDGFRQQYPIRGFWRKRMNVRVSNRLLLQLAHDVFSVPLPATTFAPAWNNLAPAVSQPERAMA
ncbi:MAG: hypothetical protein WCO56_10595 [Verrucomicrobiota bacterium]